MECGSVVEEQVEVNFDGISNQIVHVVQQAAAVASPPSSSSNKDHKIRPNSNHHQESIGIPARTMDHIHVDDMTDEEIHRTWYTKDDIMKFKKEKKLARQLRKRRIQKQRQNGTYNKEDDSSCSSCSSTSTTSSSASQKRVSWGIAEPTGLVTPEKVTEETAIAAVPLSPRGEPSSSSSSQTKVSQPGMVQKSPSSSSSALGSSPRSSTSGVQYKILMKAQRNDQEQRRVNEIHKLLFESGLLYRGVNDRDEQYRELVEDNEIFTDAYQDDDVGTTTTTASVKEEESKSELPSSSNPTTAITKHGQDLDVAEREMEEISELLEVRESLTLEFAQEVDEMSQQGQGQQQDYEEEETKDDVLYQEQQRQQGHKHDVPLKPSITSEFQGRKEEKEQYDDDEERNDFLKSEQQPSDMFDEVIFITHSNGVPQLLEPLVYGDEQEEEDGLGFDDGYGDSASPHRPFLGSNNEVSMVPTPPRRPLNHPQRSSSSTNHHHHPTSFSFPSYPAPYEGPSDYPEYSFESRLDQVAQSEGEQQRSPELLPLTREYQDFRRKLHNLVKSVQKYQAAMIQLDKARSTVRKMTRIYIRFVSFYCSCVVFSFVRFLNHLIIFTFLLHSACKIVPI